MSRPAITVENLSKAYRIGLREEIPDTLVGALKSLAQAPFRNYRRLKSLDTFRPPVAGRPGLATDVGEVQPHPTDAPPESDLFWALKNVSFEVQEGEVLGVIGRNGAGKSTLLKVLSRITEPTSGRAVIRGRVSSLLEVGTGFHPELTGRENVYMNGTILGMTKREIDRKFDEIVEFSGVEQFLDTPIKRYSSGMKVRLAFSVAAHLEPEILIIDEVLAVGDTTFQLKCVERMSQVAAEGRTILFVSHNLDMIPRLCTSAAYLHEGRLKDRGSASGIVENYLSDLSIANGGNLETHGRTGTGAAQFAELKLLDPRGRQLVIHESGSDLRVSLRIRSEKQLGDVALAITLATPAGFRVVSSWTRELETSIRLEPGMNEFECEFQSLDLRPGHQFLVMLWMAEGNTVLDFVKNAALFTVADGLRTAGYSTCRSQGAYICPSRWRNINRGHA